VSLELDIIKYKIPCLIENSSSKYSLKKLPCLKQYGPLSSIAIIIFYSGNNTIIAKKEHCIRVTTFKKLYNKCESKNEDQHCIKKRDVLFDAWRLKVYLI